MEAELNILPARVYENVWHSWLQKDTHMLGLKAPEYLGLCLQPLILHVSTNEALLDRIITNSGEM
jgi:hypothetical protein